MSASCPFDIYTSYSQGTPLKHTPRTKRARSVAEKHRKSLCAHECLTKRTDPIARHRWAPWTCPQRSYKCQSLLSLLQVSFVLMNDIYYSFTPIIVCRFIINLRQIKSPGSSWFSGGHTIDLHSIDIANTRESIIQLDMEEEDSEEDERPARDKSSDIPAAEKLNFEGGIAGYGSSRSSVGITTPYCARCDRWLRFLR